MPLPELRSNGLVAVSRRLSHTHRLLLGVQRVPGSSSGMRSFRWKGSPTGLLFPRQRGSRSSLCASADPACGDRDSQVRSTHSIEGGARVKPTLRQACSRPKPRAQFAFKDSMIHIICNSHYVSHFAAFFIDTGAKISVVESCLWFDGNAVSEEVRALVFRLFESRIGWGLVPAGAAGVVDRCSRSHSRPHPSDGTA